MIWRLHREVERRGRLVEQDEFGLERDGAGDGDALALAAGEFVREAVERCCRVEADVAQRVRARARRARRPLPPMPLTISPSSMICFDRQARVERGERILEDDLHARAEAAASRPCDLVVDALALRSRSSPPSLCRQPQDAPCRTWSCRSRIRRRCRASRRCLQRQARHCRRRPAAATAGLNMPPRFSV